MLGLLGLYRAEFRSCGNVHELLLGFCRFTIWEESRVLKDPEFRFWCDGFAVLAAILMRGFFMCIRACAVASLCVGAGAGPSPLPIAATAKLVSLLAEDVVSGIIQVAVFSPIQGTSSWHLDCFDF